MLKSQLLRSLVGVSLLLGAVLWALPPAFTQAAPAILPPRPPTQVPTATPQHLNPTATPVLVLPTTSPVPGSHSAGVAAAALELQAEAPATAWTVVQWAGGGQWFDVEGWRGELGPTGQVEWWVLPPQFGLGPFRWVVYNQAGGQMVAVSADFYLPSSAADHVVVTVMPVPTATAKPSATPKRIK